MLTRKVHGKSAIELNKMDGASGRTVWYRCRDARITFEKSYLARLSYVYWNPVKHGIVNDPANYRWCSARWFQEHCDRPFYETVMRTPHDKVRIEDDF
jgi:putative transposase